MPKEPLKEMITKTPEAEMLLKILIRKSKKGSQTSAGKIHGSSTLSPLVKKVESQKTIRSLLKV